MPYRITFQVGVEKRAVLLDARSAMEARDKFAEHPLYRWYAHNILKVRNTYANAGARSII